MFARERPPVLSTLTSTPSARSSAWLSSPTYRILRPLEIRFPLATLTLRSPGGATPQTEKSTHVHKSKRPRTIVSTPPPAQLIVLGAILEEVGNGSSNGWTHKAKDAAITAVPSFLGMGGILFLLSVLGAFPK